jgi:hypothetical protein
MGHLAVDGANVAHAGLLQAKTQLRVYDLGPEMSIY